MFARVGRALLIVLLLFHGCTVVGLSIPAPSGGNVKRNYERPLVKAELERLSSSLRQFGYEGSPKELGESLFRLSTVWLSTRKKVLSPFVPYAKFAGTRQGWIMFGVANRTPERLHVEIGTEAGWRTLFLGDEREGWRGGLLRHELSRSMLFRYAAPKAYDKSFESFARWVAGKVGEDFPDVRRVRVRLETIRSPSPAERRSGVEYAAAALKTVIVEVP